MNDLPKGWMRAPLRDLVEVLDHLRVPVNQTERQSRPGKIPYYGATGRVGSIDAALFDEPLVLLGKDGVQFFDWGRPKAYVIEGPAWVNNHAHVLRAVHVDRRYLKHFLDQVDYRGLATGTTRLKLTQSAMSRIEVVLPPPREQSRIADELERRLSHVEAAIRALASSSTRLAATRHAIAQAVETGSLVRLAGGDPGPYLKNLASETSQEHLDATCRDGELPLVRLGDLLVDIQAGKSYACEGRPAEADEWGVVKVSAMSWGSFLQGENKALPAGVVPPDTFEIHPGDLLISRANTRELVGASVLVEHCRPRLLLSDKSLRLITAPSVNKSWLRLVLSSPQVRRQMSDLATGVKDSMRNISQEKLKSVVLHLPTPEDQERLAVEATRRLSYIGAADAGLSTAMRKAVGLRQALLAAAFAGRLVPHDPRDEPAEALLERIKASRLEGDGDGAGRRRRSPRKEVAS